MRRVVVTGLGIVSCLGNNRREVFDSLYEGRSGISYQKEYERFGLRSRVAGGIRIHPEEHIPRKALRFMGNAAAYACIAMQQAIEDCGLAVESVSNERVGVVAGSGGASSYNLVDAADSLRSQGIRGVGPFRVPRTMSSTVSACLANYFKIKGVNYSITSACATSAHCIGHAMELIQLGKQDLIFAGGGEEENWTLSLLFDAMGALSSEYNETPEKASRPFDVRRDGFVIAGGAGILVLEERERAIRRGAKIYAELAGYGANSDGFDMVLPSGEGAERCMRQALASLKPSVRIDYINAHGTGTQQGDIKEMQAISGVFGEDIPPISSTKSLSGHSLGAAGVHEAIYSLIMMENDFLTASANTDCLDPNFKSMPVVRERRDGVRLNAVMSNSFGFGGTNACLIFCRDGE